MRAPCEHPQMVMAARSSSAALGCIGHIKRGDGCAMGLIERHVPAVVWPVKRAIGLLFKRERLTIERKLRHRACRSPMRRSNAISCVDFEGWFLIGDGMDGSH